MRAIRERELDTTIVAFASALAIYFGLVYVFSFSQAAASARHAIHLAILLMDGVLTLMLFREMRSWIMSRHPTPSVLRYVAYGLLVCVILLHIDYVLARSRGAEDGVLGPLAISKIYVLALQLICTYFLTQVGMPSGFRAVIAALKVDRYDAMLLSIAVIPLATYMAHNRTLFSLQAAIGYFAFFLLCPLAAILFVRLLERPVGAAHIAVPATGALTFVYYSMPMVSGMFARPVEGLIGVQVGLALAASITLTALYRANRRSVATTLAIVTAGAVSVSVVHARVLPRDATATPPRTSGTAEPEGLALTALLSKPLERRPDVYLLVYDGYAPSALMRRYGIKDDSDEYLAQKGFTIYPEAYSLFMSSRPSIGSLMDMHAVPRAGIGGPTAAAAFFGKHGYETHLILNSYLLQGSAPIAADFVFPPARRRSPLSALYRGIAGGEFKAGVVFEDSDRDAWLGAKGSVLTATAGPPRMMYAHSGFPGHSQNSGRCRPDETAVYDSRLSVARTEMKHDIDSIARSGREAVIVIAGDHGPFLTGDCLYMAGYDPHKLSAPHLADRYGSKLAILWPEGLPGRFDRIQVIQDVFFAIFASLLEDERVWTHRLAPETAGYGGIPDGAVKNGVVTIGPDKGRRLFD